MQQPAWEDFSKMASSSGKKDALDEPIEIVQNPEKQPDSLDLVLKDIEVDNVDECLEKIMIYRPKILLDECVDHKYWYHALREMFSKKECGINHVCKLNIQHFRDSEVVDYAHNHGYEMIITSDRKDFPKEDSIRSRYPEIKKRLYIRQNISNKTREEYRENIVSQIKEFRESRNDIIAEGLKSILY